MIACLLCVLLLTGCAAPADHTADGGKLSVVCTLFPYYDFARQIAGDRAEIVLLLSPGREAHSFEPTPRDALTIAHADVFLCNGGEGELWVEEMLRAAGENIGVIARMMDQVDAHAEDIVAGMQLRGKSVAGEKTMLDAMIPARDAFKAALDAGKGAKDALADAVAAAEQGVEYTKTIIATKGRASYLGERSLGHQDPGATSFTTMLKVAAAHV